jgi:phosphatidylglycerol:prolipoprotein diacylglycerol transferase
VILGTIFTGLGYLVGALVLWWAASGKRLATKGMGWVAFSGFFAGIIGAKLTQLFAEGWPFRVSLEAGLDPRAGGRALLGGLIFGWLGVEVSKWRLGIRRSTGDLFALALPAGEAVGRIGCFFNGCCYGSECKLPWAVSQHGAWRHPSQIYSAVVSAALFGGLLWIRPHLKREGDLFLLYLFGFGATRFLLEFVRWRESLYFSLSPMQWFCLELVFGSLIAFGFKNRKAQSAMRTS